MLKVEPDQTLCRIIKSFHLLGIWRNEDESESRKLRRRSLYLVQHTSWLALVLICAFLSDDRNQQIFLATLAIAIAVMTIKLAYLLWRKDEILEFFYDPIVTHCVANYSEWVKVCGKVEKIVKFNKVYLLSIVLGAIFTVAVPSPIFTSDRLLPLFIRFELECDYDFILYWLAYALLSAGCLFCVVYNCVMVLVWYIMFNYSIEYKVLGNRFKRLGWKTDVSKVRNSFQHDLIALIRAHRNLVETVERFRTCFSTFFLTEITTGAISICAATYNLAYSTSYNFFQVTCNVVILLYAFFDIFLVMYLANEITVESDRLSYSLFESNWTDQSEKTKQCIIILCEMIKQPQQLVVFIYPMNLEKFTSIVNGAYSMFNILKSFNQ